MKKAIRAAMLAIGGLGMLGAGLVACTTEQNDPTKLEFVSTGKATLTVGDTSDLWVLSKTYVDATGRTVTLKPYTYFTLKSSDPNIAFVVHNQQMVALKPGTVNVTASDDKSSLVTEYSAAITVVAAP